jgi:hypothetical protein
MHDPFLNKLLVFVAVGAIPLTVVVAILICEANSDAATIKCPQFLDQPIVKFALPFAEKEAHDLSLPVMNSDRLHQTLLGVYPRDTC